MAGVKIYEKIENTGVYAYNEMVGSKLTSWTDEKGYKGGRNYETDRTQSAAGREAAAA